MARRISCFPALLSLILLPAGGHSVAVQAQGTRPAMPSGWVEHKDSRGFVVSCPQGWGVIAEDDGRILVRSADKTVVAVVQSFLLDHATRADDRVVTSLEEMKDLFPQAQVQQKQPLNSRADEVAATASYVVNGKSCQVNVLCSIMGRSGMLFAIAAPNNIFAAKKPVLLNVLRSVHFVQPTAHIASSPGQATGAAKPIAQVKYVKWTAPQESAFTVSVGYLPHFGPAPISL